MKPSIACLCLSILASWAPHAQAAEAATPITQHVYMCERGAMIPVTYVNTKEGDAYAVALIEGRQVAMTLAPSGSGARYVAVNEQESYRWHTKGDEAMLSFMEADHEAEEETLLSQCRTAPAEVTDGAKMANPASEHCVAQGGFLEIRDGAQGQTGYCHLPDGRVVEEWAFFRSQ